MYTHKNNSYPFIWKINSNTKDLYKKCVKQETHMIKCVKKLEKGTNFGWNIGKNIRHKVLKQNFGEK